MRPELFALLFLFLSSCQFNSADNASLVIVGKTNKKSYPIPLIYNGPITTKSKKYVDQQVKFSFESNLIFNSKFIFLEYVKIGTKQLSTFKKVTANYAMESYLTDVYDIGAHPINIKYENVIGRNIFMNAYDRTQFKAKIKSIVLINDRELKNPISRLWWNYLKKLVLMPFGQIQVHE